MRIFVYGCLLCLMGLGAGNILLVKSLLPLLLNDELVGHEFLLCLFHLALLALTLYAVESGDSGVMACGMWLFFSGFLLLFY